MTVKAAIPLTTIPLLLVAAACSGDAAGTAARWTATVDTLGDTIRVHTVSGSVWRDTATLEPELTTRLAITGRAGLARAFGDRTSEALLGLSIY